MRKAKLTLEKHLLPSHKSPINEHNAKVIFDLHDELTEAVMEFYNCARRNVFRRKELVEKMVYCSSKIKSDLKEVVCTNEYGKPVYIENTLRTSALDRLLKVTRDADLLIKSNPL